MNRSGGIRVLYDLTIAAHAIGGIRRYTLSLAEALRTVAPLHGLDFETLDVPAAHPGVPAPDVSSLTLRTPVYLRVPLLRRAALRGCLEERSRAGRLLRTAGRLDVFHHSGVQPARPEGAVSVLTVYDLSALEHPEWHTAETVAFAEKEAELIAKGSRVAAISRWTAEKVKKRFRLDEERVETVGGAADDMFTPGNPSPEVMRSLGLRPGDYFLCVGNFVPRKNLEFLADAYGEATVRGVDIPLVLAGAGGWGDAAPPDRPYIRVLANLPDSCMPDLYRGARALLNPSIYEGLGLPVLEAFACRTPVVSSRAAALEETVGEWGVLLEPDDAPGWAREISALMDPGRVETLGNMSASAKRRTWREVAESMCRFYRRIADR